MNPAFSDKRLDVVTLAGDGIGPEIMSAACAVLDAAVKKAYEGKREITWLPYPAGVEAIKNYGAPLPDATLHAIRESRLALKGPLTTPVGGGIRSANVLLRQVLDLYVCQRPVRSISALPSPLASQALIDVVVFRENSEDLYAGVEFEAGSPENQRFMRLLESDFTEEYKKFPFAERVGIGIKPISCQASQRITRAAIRWALQHGRRKLTLVHKGNIMKYTEGAFLNWGYDVAEEEFESQCFTQRQFYRIQKERGIDVAFTERTKAVECGVLMVTDVIADVAFEQAILQPQTFDVVVTTNLNGDYLSDAFSALAGGVGISPSANINPESGLGVFEANHGSAEDIAGQDKANPCSLILSGAMLLEFCDWQSAADLVHQGVQGAIAQQEVTFDLARLLPKAKLVGTQRFAEKMIACMDLV